MALLAQQLGRGLPWQRGQIITDSARGWGCVMQSDFLINGHGNEVPVEGVSLNDSMYVFFTTDHYEVGDRDEPTGVRAQMGRTVLARSNNNGRTFDHLYNFSRSKFVNVSAETVN